MQLINSPWVIDLYLACLRLGVVFVPVNVLYRDREVSHILSDSAPRLFLTPAHLDELRKAIAAAPDTRPAVALDASAPAAIVYTSPWQPRVFPRAPCSATPTSPPTRRRWWRPGRISAADRFLLALPLFHVHALGNGLHTWLLTGCPMRLLERFDHRTAARDFLEIPPHALLRRAHGLRPHARLRARDGRRDRPPHAPVRFRLGAAAGARAGGTSARATATPSWSATG